MRAALTGDSGFHHYYSAFNTSKNDVPDIPYHNIGWKA